MVAPHHVEVLVVAEGLHDEVCAWSSVKDIAEQVQFVYGETLYEVTDGYDKLVSPLCVDDALDDDIVVLVLLVRYEWRLVKELFDDVSEFLW